MVALIFLADAFDADFDFADAVFLAATGVLLMWASSLNSSGVGVGFFRLQAGEY